MSAAAWKVWKEDALEVEGIVAGDGSVMDKANAAAEPIKDPGAPGPPSAGAGA